MKTYASILLTVIFLHLAGCGSDNTSQTSRGEDAGSTDAARDISTSDTRNDADGEPDADETTDAEQRDMSTDAGQRDMSKDEVECICANPLDTCIPETGTCMRPAAECGADGECPEGYRCISIHESLGGGNACICDGPAEECGPFCDTDGQCPGRYLACDFNAATGGVCRQDIACNGDYECGPGFICEYNDALEIEVCTKTQDGAEGTPCTERVQCVSGVCSSDGVCVTPCQANADCPSGELCLYSVFDADASDGCQPGTCPIPSCDETTSRCFVRAADGMEFCEPKYCETSADCENDCIVSPGSLSPGKCAEPDSPGDLPDCKPNEYKLYPDDPYCRLPGPCWDAAICQNNGQPCDDCPTGYECLRPDPNKASRATFAFCSRLLPTD